MGVGLMAIGLRTYTIYFDGDRTKPVTVNCPSDEHACDVAEQIYHSFTNSPEGYQVWEGERHVFCGPRQRKKIA
jgi:hypothetical protein